MPVELDWSMIQWCGFKSRDLVGISLVRAPLAGFREHVLVQYFHST